MLKQALNLCSTYVIRYVRNHCVFLIIRVSLLQTAVAFRKHIKNTSHASEHLFNPFQMSPQLGVPGAYTGTQRYCIVIEFQNPNTICVLDIILYLATQAEGNF